MKQIINQEHIHQIVSSESFQKVVDDIVTLKSTKDHTLRQRAIDNIINLYPTIVDRYFKAKSSFNNDELVTSAILSPAGVSTVLSKQFHQASIIDPLLDQFISVSPLTTETASHKLNKRLSGQNDAMIQNQLDQHQRDLEIEKLTRRIEDQDKQVQELEPHIKEMIKQTAEAKAKTTVYGMNRQVKTISFEGKIVNDLLSKMPVMGDVKVSMV